MIKLILDTDATDQAASPHCQPTDPKNGCDHCNGVKSVIVVMHQQPISWWVNQESW